MPPNSKQQKPIFKFVVTPKGIFVQSSKPKRSTVVIIGLTLLLIIVLLIAAYEDGLSHKSPGTGHINHRSHRDLFQR